MNTNTSWYEQELVKEFTTIINHSFPEVGKLLDNCHVKLIQSFWGQQSVHFLPYIAIYCPKNMIAAVKAQISVFREVAFFVGLTEVVCLNATSLLHDPKSKLKQNNPYLWLELQWIVTKSYT
ncbi:hypothetical protein [Brasilonema sp. UFV-L1]|uniref:hypothetical protein n=1 Tax=Brasilonema sp. UFV-L1 TaxID=2234130 RepID=UPI00145F3E49|nr:hypothetical protein [Brasilonema sp. UFV-L1]NMG06818.1 hypothetical protein [Brasilonema sp. UFV-L1]